MVFSARFLPAAAVAFLSLHTLTRTGLGDVLYNDFSTISGLTVNGNAATASTSDGSVLRLTPSSANQAGSAFTTARVSTTAFTSVFSFRITAPGGATTVANPTNGADGMVFTIQNAANNAVGLMGGGLGYQNITPSVAVAFDTWQNPGFNDPSASYVGIDVNGSMLHDTSNGPTATVNSPTQLGDGGRWWSWVTYNAGTMNVYLLASESTTEPAMPAVPLLSYNIDLQSTLGGSTAFAGFTGATQIAWENHDVIYWRYAESVPEPTSLGILLLGIGGVLRRRRYVKQ